MHLLFYIVAFVTSEGGDWGTTRRSSCLHKGVRVPNVRYLTPVLSDIYVLSSAASQSAHNSQTLQRFLSSLNALVANNPSYLSAVATH